MFQLVFKTHDLKSWSYALPSKADPDGDTVTTTVDVGTATFINFSGGSLLIGDLSDAAIIPDTYNIEVKLFDGIDSATFAIKIVI